MKNIILSLAALLVALITVLIGIRALVFFFLQPGTVIAAVALLLLVSVALYGFWKAVPVIWKHYHLSARLLWTVKHFGVIFALWGVVVAINPQSAILSGVAMLVTFIIMMKWLAGFVSQRWV